jgi:8-oxo-dGTP pyrophosphatase MutT (NUDIX family)
MPADPPSFTPPRREKRQTARVVLLRTDDRVLLLRGGDPQRPEVGTWWFTLGGGIESGKASRDAACRELTEETGLIVMDPGDIAFHLDIEHEFDGVIYEQSEDYFLIRTQPFDMDTSGWSPIEVATVVEHRWWAIDELRRTDDRVFPEGLVEYLNTLI